MFNVMKTKILRNLCIVFFFYTVLSVSATNYFVKTDAPSENNGLTWESAFNIADFISAIGTTIVDGDAVYFAGGTYYPTLTTGIKLQNVNLTLKGGYPTNLTGTNIPELIYPTATPTILNGDNNADGIPNTGDVRNVIYVQTTNTGYMAIERNTLIQGFTLTNCFYSGTTASQTGAICADCTQTVTIKNCIFENNLCENGGGAAFSNSGSKSYLVDCIIKENKAGDAGAAIRSTKRGTAAAYFTASVTVERCLFADNELTKTGSVAGGSAIRLSSGNMWILNSTIADNKGYNKGAIDMDSGTYLYLCSTTIANNQNTNTDAPKGSAIHATTAATIKLINSIMVGVKGSAEPVVYFENMSGQTSSQFFSDGANIVGLCTFVGGDGFVDNQQDIWDTVYDDCSSDNTYDAIFGANILTNNGGFSKTLALSSSKTFYEAAWLDDFVSTEYGCPFDVDELVDQRNIARSTNTSVGAYDSMLETNAVGDVMNENGIILINKGNDSYCIDGMISGIKVIDMQGCIIKEVQENIVNLSDLRKGVYLLFTTGKTFKIIR